MIIAIDIGGTKIAAVFMDGTAIVARNSARSPVHNDLSQLIPIVAELCQPWIVQARGIGVACTGRVSASDVHFLAAGIDKVLPLKEQLNEALSLPVVVLNDAWAAAWAEYELGRHGDDDTLVYITVSTAIGGGIVQNGRLLSCHSGFAAHLGHLTVPRSADQSVVCTCGRLNCAEAVASGTAIARRASDLLQREVTCEQAFTLLQEYPELQVVIDDSAAAVAQLIANVKAVTGTTLVVMGGSVGLAGAFKGALEIAMADLPALYQLTLHSAELAGDAEVLGAALAIRQHLGDTISNANGL